MPPSTAVQSRETLVSLEELEPSPVGESSPQREKHDYFPQASGSRRPNALGLSGHNSIYWLSRIQKYSTYPFAAFLIAHITNTSIIPLITQSVSASEPYLLLTRPYYQSPLAEPLLVLVPFAAHVLSGIALRIIRRLHLLKRYGAETRQDRQKLAWPRVTRTSALGFLLGPLVAGHVLLNRTTPLIVERGSSGVGLGFVSHGVSYHPVFSSIAYAALITVGSWHFVWGAAKWQGWLPEMVREESASRVRGQRRRWLLLNAIAATVAGLWMAGGMGVVLRGGRGSGWEAKNWDAILMQVPIVGPWML